VLSRSPLVPWNVALLVTPIKRYEPGPTGLVLFLLANTPTLVEARPQRLDRPPAARDVFWKLAVDSRVELAYLAFCESEHD
jgi:hypothetical protein